jgi:hypothetical protein
MVDIQFMMEIWRPSKTSESLPNLDVSVDRIGTFHQVSINGNTPFPYLDIQLSQNNESKLYFGVYKKPGELVKYLNDNSHHHRNHKTAVPQKMLPMSTKASRIYIPISTMPS